MTGPVTVHFLDDPKHTYFFFSFGVDNVGCRDEEQPDSSITINSGLWIGLVLRVVTAFGATAIIGGLLLNGRRKRDS